MTEDLSGEVKGKLTTKTFLAAAVSIVIYLSILVAGIVGIIALFRQSGDSESFVITFFRAFFGALYFPTAAILALALAGIGIFLAITFLSGGGTDSAKLTITFFIVLLFSVIGTIGSLINFRPEPNPTYLIVFALLVIISLFVHTHLIVEKNTVSSLEKIKRGLLIFPYVILSIFSAMSLVQAMLLSITTPSAQEGEGLVKVCTGIVSPLMAIVCLFIPTVIYALLWLDTPKSDQETAESEQGPSAA